MTYGHELRSQECGLERGCRAEGNKAEKIGTTLIAQSIKYIKEKVVKELKCTESKWWLSDF